MFSFSLIIQSACQYNDHGQLAMVNAFIVKPEYASGQLTITQTFFVSAENSRSHPITAMVI